MKKLIMVLAVLTVLAGSAALAAGENACGNGLSAGLALADGAGDFGFQGNITSPWFFRQHMAIRGSGFMDYRTGNDWTPYYGAQLGLVGGSFMADADIRLYGEGGFTFLFPSSKFDDDRFVLGGYGHLGFEFFVDRAHTGLSYYLELGSHGIATKTKADAGSLQYLNGFATTAGLRWYF